MAATIANCFRVHWVDPAGVPGSTLVGTLGCADKLAAALVAKHGYAGVSVRRVALQDDGSEK